MRERTEKTKSTCVMSRHLSMLSYIQPKEKANTVTNLCVITRSIHRIFDVANVSRFLFRLEIDINSAWQSLGVCVWCARVPTCVSVCGFKMIEWYHTLFRIALYINLVFFVVVVWSQLTPHTDHKFNDPMISHFTLLELAQAQIYEAAHSVWIDFVVARSQCDRNCFYFFWNESAQFSVGSRKQHKKHHSIMRTNNIDCNGIEKLYARKQQQN